MRGTPSLLLLTGPLWPGMVAPDRVLSLGWIELTAYLCIRTPLLQTEQVCRKKTTFLLVSEPCSPQETCTTAAWLDREKGYARSTPLCNCTGLRRNYQACCKQPFLTQMAFRITSQMSDASSLLRHLILGTKNHNKRPTFFVTLSAPIKSSLTLINVRLPIDPIRVGCSSWVNKVIPGCTYVNKQKKLIWIKAGRTLRRRYEIIYSHRYSEVAVSHGERPWWRAAHSSNSQSSEEFSVSNFESWSPRVATRFRWPIGED